MKFSVVIPVFNEESFIQTAIQAIHSQTLEREDTIEIIVVDNNSSDGTVLKAQSALGISGGKIVSENEQGTNYARQCGFFNSAGDVICFMDADCFCPSDWLLNIKREIEKGFVGVSGPYYYDFKAWYKIALNVLYAWVVLPAVPRILQLVFRRKGAVMLGGNIAVTREAMQKIGGLPRIEFWGDDAAIAITLARKAGSVKFTRKVWVETSSRRYREHGFWSVNWKYTKSYFRTYFSTVDENPSVNLTRSDIDGPAHE